MFENSFSVLRTNPALTGNVKLVVASDYKLYLESFAVDKTLSNTRFSHFPVKNDEFYKEAVSYFFDGVESDSIFRTKNDADESTMYADYQQQFDNLYFSGAYYCNDTFHSEEYEYLAPLHLQKDKLPENFIILRVDNAGLLNAKGDVSNFRTEIVDKWKFVKLFDLTEKSSTGTWLKKNFVDDTAMRPFPMIVNHDELRQSEIFGFDVAKTGLVTKQMNLHDVFAKDTPIFRTEEYFTGLWKENNLLYPHLLNLQFLFDDTPATPNALRKYSINRYLGFYVDNMLEVKTVSPYQGFELNKVDTAVLPTLTAQQVSELPFVKDNLFVTEIGGAFYSVDPIKNGWVDGYEYWVEFNGKQYRVTKTVNPTRSGVAGQFVYKIISTTRLEHTVAPSNNPAVDALGKRVLINELSTFYNRITIQPEIKIDEITASNIISNATLHRSQLARVYENTTVNGKPAVQFTITVVGDVKENNTFTLPDYNEADLFLMKIKEQYFVVKRYDDSIPSLGGKYYLHTDYAIEADETILHYWINNGYENLDPAFYTRYDMVQTTETEPLECPIYKVQFSDIKDFDFDRVDTSASRYEYEKDYELTDSLEPKMYAKEFRDVQLTVHSLQGDKARRVAINDPNGRPYNQRAFNGDINPKTGVAFTPSDLYQQNHEGNWHYFEGEKDGNTFQKERTDQINLPRSFYREENYILRFDNNREVDFKTNSTANRLVHNLTWGTTGLEEESDTKDALPQLSGLNDPNDVVDLNYVPVSSEYIQSDELWEIRANQTLSPIWNKNQSVCKWGAYNSLSNNDLPYRLNYSLTLGGLFNNVPNTYSTKPYPVRANRDLDYFYRFGLVTPAAYNHYTLHLRDEYFDVDQYLLSTYDYFTALFKSDQLTSQGIVLTHKYASFISDNAYEHPYTIFKGIKYQLLKVERVLVDEEEYAATGRVLIDEITTQVAPQYAGYKLSIVFGRKRSIFRQNPGAADNNFGIDVYLNDVFKNVVVHVYVDTNEVIEMYDPKSGQYVNVETCEVDVLYNDNLDTESVDTAKWAQSEFRVNGLGIGLRPRDLRLKEILNILTNYNYAPSKLNKNKVKFIHQYADGSVKYMNYVTTDFLLGVQFPTSFLTTEGVFQTSALNASVKFDINNTIKNRIILGNEQFSVDGIRVGSIPDLNAYNDYPVARQITNTNPDLAHWQLDKGKHPLMYRFTSAYAPIFKTVSLFQPMRSLAGSASVSGNYKFYDTSVNGQVLAGFGIMDEVIFSKCNTSGSVLKIQDGSHKDKSIYPMVDEYGYDFDARYIFASNWESDFYYTSRPIEMQPNVYPTSAGYALELNGVTDYLRIPDVAKFNLQRYEVEQLNYQKHPKNTKPWQVQGFVQPTTNTLVMNDIDDTNKVLFGGYLRTENEPLPLLSYPFKVSNWTTIPLLAAELNTQLGSRGFTVTAKTGGLVFTNAADFYFEPEHYSTFKESGAVEYYGVGTGQQSAQSFATATLQIYLPYADTLRFIVKPEHAVPTTVRIGDARSMTYSQVLDLLSAALPAYTISLTGSTDDYAVYLITAKEPGSYRNFAVESLDPDGVVVLEAISHPLKKKRKEWHRPSRLKQQDRVSDLINDVTVEFCVKFNGPGKPYETLFYKGMETSKDVWLDETATDFTWLIGRFENTNRLAFKTSHKAGTNTLLSQTTLETGKWYHVAFTSSSSTRTKTILINAAVDAATSDFLPVKPVEPTKATSRAEVVKFLGTLSRYGITYTDAAAVAARILNSPPRDTEATKIYDIIRGFRKISSADRAELEAQRTAWGITLPEAFAAYRSNATSYDYYLKANAALEWDIFVGTDTLTGLGKRTFAGALDELRIWNVARTPDEVRKNYRFIIRVGSNLNPLSGLVAYYRFDEGLGNNQIKDLMHRNLVKDQTKWERFESAQVNDGRGDTDTETTDGFVFEGAFYDGANIDVDPTTLKWVLSGADIVGYSDERYTTDAPVTLVVKSPTKPVNKLTKAQALTVAVENDYDSSISADTRVSVNKPAGSNPIRTKIILPKPVPNPVVGEQVVVTPTAPVVVVTTAPVAVVDLPTQPEELPVVVNRYAEESGVVNTSPVTESITEAVVSGNPVLRADSRISHSSNDKNSSVFKRLLQYITKRKNI